jgi:molecular chaperone IbpA
MNEISKLFDQFSNSYVGFDQIRKHFADIEAAARIPSFPPQNIYRESDVDGNITGDYVFELALSGYTPADVQVTLEKVQGVNLLTIKSEGTQDPKEGVKWFNRGIAGRAFKLSYTIADFVEVKSAVMKDGLLTVRLAVNNPIQTVKQIPILSDENDLKTVAALETPVHATKKVK